MRVLHTSGKLPWKFNQSYIKSSSSLPQQQINDLKVGKYQLRSHSSISQDSYCYASLLQACAAMKDLQRGKKLHAHLILTGTPLSILIQSRLVAMYAKCGNMDDARQVFDKMAEPNIFTWNHIIAQYVVHFRFDEAIELYHQMLNAGLKPDNYTFPPILRALAQLTDIEAGAEIHDYMIRNGFKPNAFVENALVDMYAKHGRLEDARKVFDNMSQRDMISWNSMIGAYAQRGKCEEAIELLRRMKAMGVTPEVITWNGLIAGHAQSGYGNEALSLLREMIMKDVKPNAVTVASVLPACAQLGALPDGKEIHGYVLRNDFQWNDVVGAALIDMYIKCGCWDDACHIFHILTRKTESVWNAMIAGYARGGHYEKSLGLFRQMQLEGMEPNRVTIASVLPVISYLSLSLKGKEIHGFVLRNRLESDVKLGNALIDMYSKCGSVRFARQIFDQMPKRDVISWTAMITGYGMQGRGEDAIALFSTMQASGMKPDHILFVALLSACSHCGLVAEGWEYFEMMRKDYNITPRMEHYACMVDLLGRAGCLHEAEDFIKEMPIEPSAAVWATLLGACKIHSNLEIGERVADCLFKLNPEEAGYYILMSNMYGTVRQWDSMAKVRKRMRSCRLQKNPGWSWIEVNTQVPAFHVGDAEGLCA